MANIYELTLEQQQLLDALFWEEDNEQAQLQLNKVRGQIEWKLSYLTDLLAESRAEVTVRKTALDEAKKRLEKKHKQAVATEERLKKFILESMVNAGIDKVEGRIMNVRAIPHDKLVLAESFKAESLPDGCFDVIPEQIKPINKNILEALKSGVEIEGAFVVNEPFLKEV